MPVILNPADYDRWLDPQIQDAAVVQPLLVPYPAELMQVTPVSTLVNSPRNDVSECLKPLSPDGEPGRNTGRQSR
jgi:putative SOS response-associated peptidase YedK